jgi:hypothetical protein
MWDCIRKMSLIYTVHLFAILHIGKSVGHQLDGMLAAGGWTALWTEHASFI